MAAFVISHHSSNLPKEITRSHDALSLVRVQLQEVFVPGDDVSRLATHRKFQKLVVAGVAAVADGNINLDPLGCAGQQCKKLPCFLLGDIRAEFVPAEHFVKLVRTGKERRIVPRSKARSNARRDVDSSDSAALIWTLVSKTKRKLRFSQEVIQYFGCEAKVSGLPADVGHQSL